MPLGDTFVRLAKPHAELANISMNIARAALLLLQMPSYYRGFPGS